MYVSEPTRRGPILVGLCLFLFTVFVVPVCGSGPRYAPPRSQAPATKIRGVGLNVHLEKLPIADVKALGVKWVRADLGDGPYDKRAMRSTAEHYLNNGLGVLWILKNGNHSPADEARELVNIGVVDIEVLNEPKLAGISPSQYARIFREVRDAVGTRARLYGPCLSTWSAEKYYLDACFQAGVRPDVLTFHGYLQNSPAQLTQWVEEAKRYGLPVVVSELGFPAYLGDYPYRARMSASLGDLFVRSKRAMGDTPWCWYDGPNPKENQGTGLFDWDGTGFRKPNAGYRDVINALQRG
jgi:hypothetical protein